MTTQKSSGFSGETILRRVSSEKYEVFSDISFMTDDCCVTIKKGLKTDGLSIPRLFWTIIGNPYNPKYVGSGIIHDGLYQSHAVPQKEADLLFKSMLKHNGVGIIRRNLMYYALRLFGSLAYSNAYKNISENKHFVEIEDL